MNLGEEQTEPKKGIDKRCLRIVLIMNMSAPCTETNSGSDLPYLGPTTFQAVNLEYNDVQLGQLYVCVRQDLPAPRLLPNPIGGEAFPGPPEHKGSFLEVFQETAFQIGQHLMSMNQALLKLHKDSMRRVTHLHPGDYAKNAYELLDYLKIKPSEMSIWPLVEVSKGNLPLHLHEKAVNTSQVPNSHFPPKPANLLKGPSHEEALFFQMRVDDDKRSADGWIVFYQDCQWQESTKDHGDWSSWGYITNFELVLYEPPARLAEGISSSSSSSYYAASSLMP